MGKNQYNPMRIRLTAERHQRMMDVIHRFYQEEFDEQISEFRAQSLLDFFIRELGAPIYNQAIRDAHKFMEEKLMDLEGEVYEPEEPV